MAKIDYFVAWRIYHYCYRQLEAIRIASGYNTDPSVTMNSVTFKAAQSKFALLIEVGSHGAEKHEVGGSGSAGVPRVYQVLDMTVTGSVKVGTETPRKEAFKLEQDVRTAIHKGVSSLKATIGRGAVFEFGDCPHDSGELTPEKEAGFKLSIRFGYPQGSNW